MKITCLSLFPDLISQALSHSIPGKAMERGLLDLESVQIRDFTTDKHRCVDDIPYGGGAGMVLKPEPVCSAIRAHRQAQSLVIHTSPSGKPFNQQLAQELAQREHLILVASRYEGLDQRAIDAEIDMEISLGDFVLSGGELAIAVMVDAITRLIPGALGNAESVEEESFTSPLLEYPQYTRPPEFEGRSIPDILLSGHHEKIRLWRLKQRILRTTERRPELLKKLEPNKEINKLLKEIERERGH